MRRRVIVIVAAAAIAASAVVVAVASTSVAGLPAYTDGYQKWPRLNKKPTRGTPLGKSAHDGVKNVYASKRKVGPKFPNGTVIVKSVARPGDKPALPSQVAVMRKLAGRWKFVEYQRAGSRYTVLAQGQLCQSCHARARANDFVFTKS